MAKRHTPHHQNKPRNRTGVAILAGAALLLLLGIALTSRQAASRAEDEQGRKNARALLEAAADWKAAKPKHGCPSVTQLLRDHELESDTVSADPWGGRYRILCSGQSIQLLSAGPDGEFQTGDDVTFDSEARS